jgi:electron transfer flavoprotein alpha subunit
MGRRSGPPRDTPDFHLYQPDGFATTVAAAAAGHTAVLLAASATGRDLAPRVAARPACCATDVVGIGAEGGKVLVTRPVYAGKVLQRAGWRELGNRVPVPTPFRQPNRARPVRR